MGREGHLPSPGKVEKCYRVLSEVSLNGSDTRERKTTQHMDPSDKSKLTLDFLLTPHGTLLVIVVGGGRNDPRWLRIHDDDAAAFP